MDDRTGELPMNIKKTFKIGVPLAVLGATALLSGCAVEAMSEEELGHEMLAETSAERTTRINNKYLANQALLGSEISGSTVQFSNGAKRDYTGAGNNSSIYYGDAVHSDTILPNIVLGYIRGKYLAKSAQAGVLGYPTTDELSTAFGTGRYNLFQKGRILWKNGAGQAFETHGNIDAQYIKLHQEWGQLGFPTSDEYITGNQRVNAFELGRIYMSAGVPRPVLTGNNPNQKLVQMGKPRITSASITYNAVIGGGGCVRAEGASFPPGAWVTVNTTGPGSNNAGGAQVQIRPDGTFTYIESGSTCNNGIETVNWMATLWAVTQTNPTVQAVYAQSYSYGLNRTTLP
jgi:hypothetical protein